MRPNQQYSLKKIIFVLVLFALAMAYMEAAVVVYLRELFYPEGFHFPLKMLPTKLAWVEIGREASTIAMLFAVGMAVGKSPWSRFSVFMLVFGAWDIFYYLWLWILIDWPASLLERDILFLIPLPWTGPVIAPMVVAASMVYAAMELLYMEQRGRAVNIKKSEAVSITLGAAIVLISFLCDAGIVLNQGVPAKFQWKIFLFGELMGLLAFVQAARRNRASRS